MRTRTCGHNFYDVPPESRNGMSGKFDLAENIGYAVEEAVAWHTLGIVADSGKSIGTGTAILWRQRSLILTARHVIESSPADGISFHFRHEGTMKRSPLDELWSRPDIRYTRKVALEIRGMRCSKDTDLAALEVPREIDEQYRVKFFELGEGSVTPPSETLITMRGNPRDLAKAVAPGVLASFAMVQWARIQKRPLFEPYDPKSEFLVKFVAAEQGKHARGYSGIGNNSCGAHSAAQP